MPWRQSATCLAVWFCVRSTACECPRDPPEDQQRRHSCTPSQTCDNVNNAPASGAIARGCSGTSSTSPMQQQQTGMPALLPLADQGLHGRQPHMLRYAPAQVHPDMNGTILPSIALTGSTPRHQRQRAIHHATGQSGGNQCAASPSTATASQALVAANHSGQAGSCRRLAPPPPARLPPTMRPAPASPSPAPQRMPRQPITLPSSSGATATPVSTAATARANGASARTSAAPSRPRLHQRRQPAAQPQPTCRSSRVADGANIPRPSTVASVAPLASVNSSAEPIHRSVRVVACVPVTRAPPAPAKRRGLPAAARQTTPPAQTRHAHPEKAAPSAAAVATQVAATQGDTQRAADTGTPPPREQLEQRSQHRRQQHADGKCMGKRQRERRKAIRQTVDRAQRQQQAHRRAAHGTGSRQPNTTPGAGMRS